MDAGHLSTLFFGCTIPLSPANLTPAALRMLALSVGGLDLKGKSVAGTGSGILALAAAPADAKIVVAMEVSANPGADYN